VSGPETSVTIMDPFDHWQGVSDIVAVVRAPPVSLCFLGQCHGHDTSLAAGSNVDSLLLTGVRQPVPPTAAGPLALPSDVTRVRLDDVALSRDSGQCALLAYLLSALLIDH
jgi:hypothetical protein